MSAALVKTETEKPRRETSSLREQDLAASDAKAVILTVANVLAGAFGFLESVEKGTLAGDALREEIQKGKRRARAMARVESEPVVKKSVKKSAKRRTKP